MNYVTMIWQVLLTYFVMYVFHEFGHYVMLKKFKVKKIKFRINKIIYWSNLNEKKKRQIVIVGIIAGIVPMIMLWFWSYDFGVQLLLLWAYLWACRKDLKRIDIANEFKLPD